MKKCSLGKFVEFLGIIPLTNIDFQRNIPSFTFSFFLFYSEKELLGGHLSTYQGKLADPGVMNIINEKQQNFEPYTAILDRAYQKSQFRIF